MAMTFDATLKDMGRDCPQGFLAAFDRPPTQPLTLLNVDLSTVTATADLIVGLGEPLHEIVHLEFQSSAAAWKHADLMVYNALLYAHYHAPVHTVMVLLRPEAAHSNMNGELDYAARPGRGKMHFEYEVIRLWEERTAEDLLSGDVGVAPLAMLGRLPTGVPLEEGLAAIAQRVTERLTKEVPPERAKKLLTETLAHWAARAAGIGDQNLSRSSYYARIRHLLDDLGRRRGKRAGKGHSGRHFCSRRGATWEVR